MEDLLMGQVRGILILANGAKERNDAKAYLSYLLRAKALIDQIDELRNYSEQKAA